MTMEEEERKKEKNRMRTEEVEKEDVKGKQRDDTNEYLMLSV
jgi:hypothetical protein